MGQVALVGTIDWVKDRAVDATAMAMYFHRLLEDFLKAAEFDTPQLCAFLRVMTSFKMIYCIKLGTTSLGRVFSMLKPHLPKEDAPKRYPAPID